MGAFKMTAAQAAPFSNPFEAIAEQQLTAAAKAKHRAAEKRMAKLVVTSESEAPMVAKPADKAMFEASKQFREYQRYLRNRRDELLNGPYSVQLAPLVQMLKAITLESASALTDWIEHADWLQQADYNTRHNTLAIIADSMATFRIRHGMAPFDDSLPGEPPTAFEQIRFMLTGVASWA